MGGVYERHLRLEASLYVCTHVYVYIHVHVYVFMYVSVYVCMYVCMYVCVCVCVCRSTYHKGGIRAVCSPLDMLAAGGAIGQPACSQHLLHAPSAGSAVGPPACSTSISSPGCVTLEQPRRCTR